MSQERPSKKARSSSPSPSSSSALALAPPSSSLLASTSSSTAPPPAKKIPIVPTSSSLLKFEDGAVQFRERIVCSILSQKTLLVKNIRTDSWTQPGLTRCEASFLRLVADRLTNGTQVEINSSGSQFRMKPGVLLGGTHVHDCPVPQDEDEEDLTMGRVRSVGWFLEGVLPLLCFGKHHMDLTFTGITEGFCQQEASVDYLQSSILPLLAQFGMNDDNDDGPPLSIRVVQRGSFPRGGGVVRVTCAVRRELKPLDGWVAEGKIKRIRGTAVGWHISPSSTARVAHAAKGMLHRLLPDVWIHTDHGNAKTTTTTTGRSRPALSVTLSAMDTHGHIWTVEACQGGAPPRQGPGTDTARVPELPEDLGIRAACALLEEVRRGGCIDSGAQSLVLLLMCVTPEDVSRVRVGTLTPYTIQSLRLFRRAFGVEFKVRAHVETSTVVLSCLGTGYRNMARAST